MESGSGIMVSEINLKVSDEVEQKIKAYPLFTERPLDEPSFRKRIVVGRGVWDGNSKAVDFLILGEAPGFYENDNENGEPFIGKAGGVLDNWIKTAKLESYYISNAVPLIPLKKFQGEVLRKIRRPYAQEIRDFKLFRDYVIEKVQPRRIILLGDTACAAVLNRKTRDVINSVARSEKQAITGIYHPARYIRKGQDGMIQGLKDFKRAVDLLQGL